jgi:hypothetical protein
VSANRKQQLMLGAVQARRLGLLLTPPFEASQACPEAQQAQVLIVGDSPGHDTYRSTWAPAR